MRDTGEASIADLVSRVVDDAKEAARAEIDLVKVQATDKVAGYRTPAILFAVAGLLGMAAVPAMLVGLILTLATRIGAGWATLLVIGATILLAGLLGWLGMQRVRRA